MDFLSFICKNKDASKHCKCKQVAGRHGHNIRIFPKGQTRETRNDVVAISQSRSSRNFSFTEKKMDTLMKISEYIDTNSEKPTERSSEIRMFGAFVF